MKKIASSNTELTAKQRLAVSRQNLLAASNTPLWGGLALWCLKRCLVNLQSNQKEHKQ